MFFHKNITLIPEVGLKVILEITSKHHATSYALEKEFKMLKHNLSCVYS